MEDISCYCPGCNHQSLVRLQWIGFAVAEFPCPVCDGDGVCPYCREQAIDSFCPVCDGDRKCPKCEGEGKEYQ